MRKQPGVISSSKGEGARKALAVLVAFALSFSFVGFAPASAFASDESAADGWAAAAAGADSPAYSAYSSAGSASVAALSADEAFPAAFDLRDRGVVTPVKLQNPWGTCWGFAAIAASETSILSDMGTTYDEFPLDLSERQLAYFAYSPAPEFALDQEGEGAHYTGDNPNFMFDLGGLMVYATTIFSAGIGPLYEDDVPYMNEEGIIVCTVKQKAAEGEEPSGYTTMYLTQEQIDALVAEGAEVQKLNYASAIPSADDPTNTTNTDWSVDDYLWLASSYELEASSILPDLAVFDENGAYRGYSQESMDAIKSELSAGRAVSMAFCADTSQPNQQGEAQYINENTWAHYTFQPAQANHAVTIVGWDDNYAASNFNGGVDEQTGLSKNPGKNGAWLVKNSWGAETEEFPNNMAWGVVDEDTGLHTGYFWLSYYDQSICMLETFDYDLSEAATQEGEYDIDQYNYLIAGTTLVNSYAEAAPSANVFTADDDITVRTLACETVKPNTTVTYCMYLLGEDDAYPTDGELVVEEEATYEYGGYHRLALDESAWVPLREGQRYAVSITQRCNNDGLYYQSVASNMAELSDEEKAKLEKTYRDFFEGILMLQKYNELLDQYLAEGMSEADAMAKAEAEAMAWVKGDAEMQAAIDYMVDQQIGGLISTYYVGIVNEGESFTYAPAAEGQDAGWSDWSNVVARLDQSMVYDNFPIKAFADYRDWASVDSLDALAAAVETAEQALAGVTPSADGADVPTDAKWVTQEAYDALSASLASARELLAAAGDDYRTVLVATTPAQADVEGAVAALGQATEQVNADAKPGTKTAAAGGAGATVDKGDGGKGSGDKGKFASTGDGAARAAAAGVTAALVAGGALWAVRRKVA